MPYEAIAELVLAKYRAVMHRLDVLGPDAAASFELMAYAATLEDEYRALIDEAIAEGLPPPPPFPGRDAPDAR
ncbi:MAG TPA: hypothetical protein VKR21_16525 [Solirubrobacteraceae bacterium]|nr:hypothetical protein [Solirubrobacteraceae bacterium]